MDERLKQRIIVDPAVMVGKPVIKGTRVTVEAIVARVAAGVTIQEVLEDFPHITKLDVQAALDFDNQRKLTARARP